MVRSAHRELKQCIEVNRGFTELLSTSIANDWGVAGTSLDWHPAGPREFEITSTTLLQLMREWSDEGQAERDVAFTRIISELEELYPDEPSRQSIRILNPGCGLGRLVMELVIRGFWTQGNEISYHMLLASNFILNHSQFPHSHSIFPFYRDRRIW